MGSTVATEHRTPVIDFARARARLKEPGRHATLIVRVSTMKADEEIYRYVGLDENSALGDTARVIEIVFSFGSHSGAPQYFSTQPGEPSAATQIPATATLGETLDAGIYFNWGLWRFDLQLVGVYPRDDSTPPAVCIAGSGDFGTTEFRIGEVNRNLIGDDTANDVLRQTRTEVRELVTRTLMYDFILLLQALDLNRATDLSDTVAQVVDSLPRERTPEGQDAFWAVALGLACFTDEERTDSITESIFAALGYGDRQANEIRELCAGSLVRLASVGAYGAGEIPPVPRLDIFRQLLRG